MAWVGCVMEKLVAEIDIDNNLYYSLNPEKAPDTLPIEEPISYLRADRHPLQGEFVLVRPWNNKLPTRAV